VTWRELVLNVRFGFVPKRFDAIIGGCETRCREYIRGIGTYGIIPRRGRFDIIYFIFTDIMSVVVGAPMGSRFRKWCFTAWEINEDPLDICWLNVKYDDQVVFLVYQIEKAPDTGTLHAQGVVWFKNPRFLQGVKRYFESDTMHLEPCKYWDASVEYCTKEETREAGPFKYGTEPECKGQGHRSDLDEAFSAAKEGRLEDVSPSTLLRYHRGVEKVSQTGVKERWSKTMRPEIEVLVFWGPPGVGKSYWCNTWFEDAYRKRPDTKWWDGYEEEDTIIIDEFRGQIDYRMFLQICDRYPLCLEIKGGHTYAAWTRVIIISNYEPEKWYPGEQTGPLLRRVCRCTEVTGNTKVQCTVPSREGKGWVHKMCPDCQVGKYHDWPSIEEPEIVDYGDDNDELEEL